MSSTEMIRLVDDETPMEFQNIKLDRSVFALTVIRFEHHNCDKKAAVELDGYGSALLRCPELTLEEAKRLITVAGFNNPDGWVDTGQGFGFSYQLL